MNKKNYKLEYFRSHNNFYHTNAIVDLRTNKKYHPKTFLECIYIHTTSLNNDPLCEYTNLPSTVIPPLLLTATATILPIAISLCTSNEENSQNIFGPLIIGSIAVSGIIYSQFSDTLHSYSKNYNRSTDTLFVEQINKITFGLLGVSKIPDDFFDEDQLS